jgi:PAS domain S-box-containing protein
MVTSNLFGFTLLVMSVLSALSVPFAYQKRDDPGGSPLVIFQAALTIGLATYAVDVYSTDLAVQYTVIWFTVVSQGIVAGTWVYVAIEYSGLDRWATRKTAAALAVEPVALALVILSPLRDSLVLAELPSTGVTDSILGAEALEVGALFGIHLSFVVLSTALGSILFVQLFVRSRNLYRTQAVAVLTAAVAPWALLILSAQGLITGGDPTVLGWAIAGLALTAGLYRFKTLDPIPTAKESVVEKMGAGVIVLDEDEMVGEINPAADQFLSKEKGVVGSQIDEVFDGWEALDQPTDGTTDWQEIELTIGGERRFAEAQVSAFSDRFDQVVGWFLVIRDVTERTRRERELARFERIFESVSDRVYVLDETDEFVMANEPFASLVGHSTDDLTGRSFDSILLDGGVPDETDGVVELTVETADGDQIPCESRLSPISFEGVEAGTVGILRDVSRRKELEASLAETTQQLQTIVEASPLAVVGMDGEGHVEVWNPAAEEMFGWPAEDVRGALPPVVSSDREREFADLLDRATAGERITGHELAFDRSDGSQFTGSLSLAPIADSEAVVRGVVGIVADITEQKQRQRRLEQQNERLDQFASVVSHDLRNPLSSAKGYLDLAKTQGDDEYFEKVETAHDRMERMIDELLTLARTDTDIEETQTVAIDELADDAWETAQTDGASFDNDVPAGWTVEADPGLVRNIVENLYRNAVDHNDDPVQIRVGTTEEGFFIEDDGEGIPPDERETVFEYGYTTNRNGTGFGLSIVNDIAEAHGWDVSVTEGTAGGARFEFETAA